MKIQRVIILILIAALSGCGLMAQEPEMSPQEVTTKFYRWYIGYPGNPLVDKEYRESPYLAESFIQEIDDFLEGSFMADPILLAQDIPERFTVDETDISGDQATVHVSFYWGGNPTPSKRQITLTLIENEWKITDVAMIE
jgi:hypothetical protein